MILMIIITIIVVVVIIVIMIVVTDHAESFFARLHEVCQLPCSDQQSKGSETAATYGQSPY